jgi:hypothetical protein
LNWTRRLIRRTGRQDGKKSSTYRILYPFIPNPPFNLPTVTVVSDILDSRSNKEDEHIIDGTDTRSGRAGKHVA